MATSWDAFPAVGQAPPVSPSFPGVIPGRPKVPEPPSAVELENLRLRQKAGERAERAEVRAENKDARQAEKDMRGSVEQGKAAGFAQRAVNAEQNFSSIRIDPRGYVGQKVANAAPDFANAFLDDEKRQLVSQAEREFIAALLRYDSGAAIPDSEYITMGKTYFPRAGDSEEVVAQKAEARRVAIEGLVAAAGPAGKDIELPLIVRITDDSPAGGDARDRDDEGFYWRNTDDSGNDLGGVFDQDGNPLGPDGGLGFDAEGNQLGLYGRVTDTSPNIYDQQVAAEAAQIDEISGKKDIVGLAGEGLMLGLGDEAAGVGTVIAGALTGDFDISGNYQRGRDVDRLRTEQARERFGWGATAAEIVGGGALGKVSGGINSLMGAGRAVAARGVPITRGAIQGQLARSAAKEGALAGAVGGYGYGEGLEGSATNALVGAGAGALVGYGGQKIGNALANRSGPQVAGQQVLQAADDLSIPVIPAVTGGATARRLTGGARQGFISDRPISGAVDRMEGAGGAARNRAASQTGRVLDNEDAGNVVRQAANVYSKRTSQIGGNLYDRADRMAGGVEVPLPKAVAAADRWLAELEQAAEGTGGTLYKEVKKLRDQMAARKFTVKGIRQTRTTLREQMQERGLRGSATEKVYGEILEAATEDLGDGLTAAGKDNAVGALKTANAFWKKRVETIDEVLEPVLGKNAPRSGEQIVTAIEGLMKSKTGNASRLRQLLDAMPKEERQSVAATIISRMGQPTAGAAEKGSSFSFNTFLTNWNNMSPRARAAMFPAETRDALDKLATVSMGVKQGGAAANTSNSGGAIAVQGLMSGGLWILDPMTAVGAAGGQWMIGRLLASPRIARWIASAPKNANARKAHIAKLGGIARAEPALANEIGLLQRAANDNLAASLPAAADEERAN